MEPCADRLGSVLVRSLFGKLELRCVVVIPLNSGHVPRHDEIWLVTLGRYHELLDKEAYRTVMKPPFDGSQDQSISVKGNQAKDSQRIVQMTRAMP